MVKSTQISSSEELMTSSAKNTHLYILLDRSGSMESIAGDVIGGYNAFLRDQKKDGEDARVTLVQFDSSDVQEVLAAGVPIAEVIDLTAATFVPRGSTPLLDATGQLIARARMNEELRKQNNLPAEDIVFVTITDGEENASSEFTLAKIQKLIKKCEKDGWTFVFLSAALDAYGDAQGMGMKNGNIQAFSASSDGAHLAFTSLSGNISKLRAMKRMGMDTQNVDVFEEKIAETQRKKDEGN
jgi:Mg-chelatase subunit ChlD